MLAPLAPAAPLRSAPVTHALRFRLVDCVAALAYLLALLLNLAAARMDADLSYAVARNPRAFMRKVAPELEDRAHRWLALTAFKCLALFVGWLTVRMRVCCVLCVLCCCCFWRTGWPRLCASEQISNRWLGRVQRQSCFMTCFFAP